MGAVSPIPAVPENPGHRASLSRIGDDPEDERLRDEVRLSNLNKKDDRAAHVRGGKNKRKKWSDVVFRPFIRRVTMDKEMINDARKKITDEAAKIGGELARFVEETVNRYVNDDKAAESVMKNSLSDCIKRISSEARKHSHNGCACLTDEDVSRITLEFYGIEKKEENNKLIDIMDFI